eukprot:scaffold325_cov343-Pavlova_lutheri.AAC.17
MPEWVHRFTLSKPPPSTSHHPVARPRNPSNEPIRFKPITETCETLGKLRINALSPSSGTRVEMGSSFSNPTIGLGNSDKLLDACIVETTTSIWVRRSTNLSSPQEHHRTTIVNVCFFACGWSLAVDF